MDIAVILGVVITAVVLASVLKQYRSEYAIAVSVAAGAFIFLRLISNVFDPLEKLRELLGEAGIKYAYFAVALKALGICMISGFVSDVCKDFGQTALSGWALMAGKCAIFILSVPILSDLLEAAYKFIG